MLLDSNLYYVSGGDSMAHFMKGVIGLFISAADTVKCWNIKINSNPENVYYDWLNNVWYDSYFNNNLCNSKIISIGDISVSYTHLTLPTILLV